MEMAEIRREETRRQLVEAGVIGPVVDDFHPQIIIRTLLFGPQKQISSGAEVLFADVREAPASVGFDFDRDFPSFREILRNLRLRLITAIVTDPNDPGGEYLHWIASATMGNYEVAWQAVVPYEAPRSNVTRMLVFTLYRQNEPLNFVPNAREYFSTKRFAEANALGPPLSAAFFRIKNEKEEQHPGCDVTEPERSICSTARTCGENEDESTSKLKEIYESTSKLKEI